MRSALPKTGLTAITMAALPLIFLSSTGCVPQDRYDNVITANRSLKEQIASSEYERDEMRQNLGATQDELNNAQGQLREMEQLDRRYDDMNASIDSLDQATEEGLRRIAELEIGPLPSEVENAISALTSKHPDLLTFDSDAGMVRFASDFTFDLGSAELKRDAVRSLQTLATILNDPSGSSLEARIVGHTDNVPIRRAATKAKHPTNMHLSVNRAIAVGDALSSAGVHADRIQVAGHGEFHPIVPNGPRGAAQNRRVEIFIAAQGAGTNSTASFSPLRSDAAASVNSAREEPMK